MGAQHRQSVTAVLLAAKDKKGFLIPPRLRMSAVNPGAVQTNDTCQLTWFIFGQVDLRLKKNWNITYGREQ